MVVTFTMRAQIPVQKPAADSVSVLMRHIANTNAEIVRLNRAYTTHAAMVGVGGGAMLAGTLLTIQGNSKIELGNMSGANLIKAGTWVSAVGIAFIAASFIPLPKSVHLDERGLVVDLPKR